MTKAMILEGIVTSVSPAGKVNIAPMGPRVEPAMQRFVLRPFATSQTYRNLKAHGEGVLHVTDDVLLLARATIGVLSPVPPLMPASRVAGYVLQDTCRYYEFRVQSMDESQERIHIEAEVLYAGHVRDFFGFNRAKHAIVEAAILASRAHFLPPADVEDEYRKLGILVEKTGGPQECEAFALLQSFVQRAAQAQERPS
jgi:hypothetical protein